MIYYRIEKEIPITEEVNEYYVQFVALMPVENSGTVSLPGTKEDAYLKLIEALDEQYGEQYKITYFSIDPPQEETLTNTMVQ